MYLMLFGANDNSPIIQTIGLLSNLQYLTIYFTTSPKPINEILYMRGKRDVAISGYGSIILIRSLAMKPSASLPI